MGMQDLCLEMKFVQFVEKNNAMNWAKRNHEKLCKERFK